MLSGSLLGGQRPTPPTSTEKPRAVQPDVHTPKRRKQVPLPCGMSLWCHGHGDLTADRTRSRVFTSGRSDALLVVHGTKGATGWQDVTVDGRKCGRRDGAGEGETFVWVRRRVEARVCI
ncbi:unnamed protein product [Sphacelaria rigidula]